MRKGGRKREKERREGENQVVRRRGGEERMEGVRREGKNKERRLLIA